jgi:acetyltransferase-like isoleucine patch superfamily enzyme
VSALRHVEVVARQLRTRAVRRILAHRIQVRHPTLVCDPTAIWDYGYDDIDAIQLGQRVQVHAFTEIVVQKRSVRSSVEGRLILGDRAVIAACANIRAAGGVIEIGAYSGIGQQSVVVAANHDPKPGQKQLYSEWDESRTGVRIGQNVWVAAGCILLPGVTIGDDVVIAAGSVVTRSVPSGEVWGGFPARKIRDVDPNRVRATTADSA